MAYKVGTVLLEIKSDTAKLVSGMDRAEKSIYKLKRSFADLVQAAATIYGITKTFQLLNSIIIETSAKFEKFSLILETLEGSSAKAQKDLEWIKKFAQTTPYEIDKVTEAFVKLKSYGLSAQKELRVLGDTAAALGKPLNMAVEAIADAVTGEFERLKEFGVKAYQQGEKVAFTWSDASGKARYIVVKNNREVIESTLTAIWNSKYEGAMGKLSHSWDGILSNMADSWTNFKAETSHLAFNEAKKDLLVFAGVWNKVLNDIKEPISEFEVSVVKSLKQIILFSAAVDDGISDLIGVIVHFSKGVLYSFDEMTYSIPVKIEKLINGIIDVINSAPDFIKKTLGGDLKHLNYFSNLTNTYSNAAKKEFREAWKYLGRITKGEIGEVTKYWLDSFKTIENSVTSTSKKTKMIKKEIGTVGEFNIDLLKNETERKKKIEQETDELNEQQKIINKLFKDALNYIKDLQHELNQYNDPYKQLEKWREAQLEKLNQIKQFSLQYNQAKELFEKLYQFKKQKLDEETLQKAKENYKKYIDEKYKYEKQLVDSIAKTYEDNLFNFLTGKYKTLGDFVKDLFKDVAYSIEKSLSNALAKGLKQSLYKKALPSFTSVAGAANALGLKKNKENGLYEGLIRGQKVVVDSSGNVLAGASKLGVKNIYDFKKPGSLTSAFNNVSLGASDWFNGNKIEGYTPISYKIGYHATGAVIGGIGGYFAGGLGDRLFGADTRASQYGAISGAIGGIFGGPGGAVIGASVGSLIGGMFGHKKKIDEGIEFFATSYFNHIDAKTYEEFKKSNWFSSKNWKTYEVIDEYTKDTINRLFLTYNQILKNISKSYNFIIQKGEFKDVGDAFAKSFLGKFSENVKTAWEKYAKETGQELNDAIISLFKQYITTKRSYLDFILKTEGEDLKALQLQINYAKEEVERLKELIGKAEINKDNFLEYYEEIIKNSPSPEVIEEWNDLAEAFEKLTQAQVAYKEEILSEYDAQAKYQEYLISLNETLSKDLENLVNNFEELTKSSQNYIDSLYQYSSDENYIYYLQRFNEVKKELDIAIADGNIDLAKGYFSELQNLSNYVFDSAPLDIQESLNDALISTFESYNNLFNVEDNILKVLLVADESGEFSAIREAIESGDTQTIQTFIDSHEEELEALGINTDELSNVKTALWADETTIEALQSLNANLETYNKSILNAVDDANTVTWDELWTDPSLYDNADIQKIIQDLSLIGADVSTQDDLNKWLNILGNLRFNGLSYFTTLDSTTQQQIIKLGETEGWLDNLINNINTASFSVDENIVTPNIASDTSLSSYTIGDKVTNFGHSLEDLIQLLQNNNWSNYIGNDVQIDAWGQAANSASYSFTLPSLEDLIGSDAYNTYLTYKNLIEQGLITSPDMIAQYNSFMDEIQSAVTDEKNKIQEQITTLQDYLNDLNKQIADVLGEGWNIDDLMKSTWITKGGITTITAAGKTATVSTDYTDELSVATSTGKAIENYINALENVLNSAYTDIELKKFAIGGFTDETGERVAGIVHAGEWVAPRWMVENYRGVFGWLEDARKKRSLQMPSLVTSPINAINVNIDMQEVKITNSILKEQLFLQQKMYRLLQKFDEEGIRCIS